MDYARKELRKRLRPNYLQSRLEKSPFAYDVRQRRSIQYCKITGTMQLKGSYPDLTTYLMLSLLNAVIARCLDFSGPYQPAHSYSFIRVFALRMTPQWALAHYIAQVCYPNVSIEENILLMYLTRLNVTWKSKIYSKINLLYQSKTFGNTLDFGKVFKSNNFGLQELS